MSQLLALEKDGVHGVVAPSQELAFTFLLRVELGHAVLRREVRHLGAIHATVAAHCGWLGFAVDDVIMPWITGCFSR